MGKVWVTFMPGYQSGQLGLTVNQLTYVYRGSNPFPGTIDNICQKIAHLAQLVEHIHGKDVVGSSILPVGSIIIVQPFCSYFSTI